MEYEIEVIIVSGNVLGTGNDMFVSDNIVKDYGRVGNDIADDVRVAASEMVFGEAPRLNQVSNSGMETKGSRLRWGCDLG